MQAPAALVSHRVSDGVRPHLQLHPRCAEKNKLHDSDIFEFLQGLRVIVAVVHGSAAGYLQNEEYVSQIFTRSD